MNDYTLKMFCYEDGTAEERTITAENVTAAVAQADELTEDWMKGGSWGEDGACVSTGWTLHDSEGTEIDGHDFDVDIEPDHETKIRDVVGEYNDDVCGYDPDDHDWTSEGEGGLKENPGCWAGNGTTMIYDSHCRVCGLHRTEIHTGPQHNPGEHDTVEYRMLDEEEIKRHRANGTMIERYHTCAYCGEEIAEGDSAEDEVPRVSDTKRWAELAELHAPECGWIEIHQENLEQ